MFVSWEPLAVLAVAWYRLKLGLRSDLGIPQVITM